MSRPSKEAAAEQSKHDKDVGAEADGAHGGGAVGQVADHHGVDDAHAHPAELGENERKREANRGAQFGAKSLQADHERGDEVQAVYGGARNEANKRAEMPALIG